MTIASNCIAAWIESGKTGITPEKFFNTCTKTLLNNAWCTPIAAQLSFFVGKKVEPLAVVALAAGAVALPISYLAIKKFGGMALTGGLDIVRAWSMSSAGGVTHNISYSEKERNRLVESGVRKTCIGTAVVLVTAVVGYRLTQVIANNW
jgi:hypothetical protein